MAFVGVAWTSSGVCALADGGGGAGGSPAFCGDELADALALVVGASGLVHPARATAASSATGRSLLTLAPVIAPVGDGRSSSPSWGRTQRRASGDRACPSSGRCRRRAL